MLELEARCVEGLDEIEEERSRWNRCIAGGSRLASRYDRAERGLEKSSRFFRSQFVIVYRALDAVPSIGFVQIRILRSIVNAVRRIGPEQSTFGRVSVPKTGDHCIVSRVPADDAM